jgi:ADP-ribose pyrophosphatase
VKFTNPWWSYVLDGYELPSGRRGEYHYVHTGGSSMVVPLTSSGKLLLVRQYRFLLDRESVEFPCGSVKHGSTHDRTAWEELAEETGYSANSLKCVGEFNPYNGITDEICRVYVAGDLRFVGGSPDETEEFELLELTPEELDARIADGSIWDGMTIAAWAIARRQILADSAGEERQRP